MRLIGVGCASHCKFKTVTVVLLATSLEPKEQKKEVIQNTKPAPKTVNIEEDDDDKEW